MNAVSTVSMATPGPINFPATRWHRWRQDTGVQMEMELALIANELIR